MKILGIDPSWSATGVALLDDGTPTEWGVIKTQPSMHPMERLKAITDKVLDMLDRLKPIELVAIEGYSFGSKANREMMGELGGVLRYRLWEEEYQYRVYTPLTWRKVVLGKAIGPKDEVGMRLVQRYKWEIGDINALEAAGVALCAYVHKQEASGWNEAQKAAFKRLAA